jgi:tRNA(Ile)-lysidine synthase
MSERALFAVLGPIEKALKRISISTHDTILIGLSGGPDSVAMTHALIRLRAHSQFELIAAHLNHGLRDAESNRDESFVRGLCASLGIELYVERTESLSTAASNLEERARELRHEFLNRIAAQTGATRIALAHHADDQAETVLTRLLRGSGVTGLRAMTESGPGLLFRPLLRIKRAAILEFLRAIGAEWVYDSSNDSMAITRNRIRHQLIPMLERDFAHGLSDRLNELASEVGALDEYITQVAREELARRLRDGTLQLNGFRSLPEVLSNAIVREFLRKRLGHLRRISRAHVTQIARVISRNDNPAARIALPGGFQFRRQYDRAVIEPRSTLITAITAEPFRIVLRLEGQTVVPGNEFVFEAKLNPARTILGLHDELDPMEAVFDLEQLRSQMLIRNYQRGDRVVPLGMGGTRKLHDVFIDRKLPRMSRQSWPLVTIDDAILWVPAMVRSRLATITPATKNILYLRAFLPNTDGLARLPENHPTC